jgi:DNA-binding transcriptional regulator YhcF (GntR family)
VAERGLLELEREIELEFALDPFSPVPAQTQIVDQIRIWLMMGRLQPGDQLPSIRELERQLGVGRSIIWAAYQELQDSGTITLTRGSLARIVPTESKSRAVAKRALECEELSRSILDQVHRRGFVLSSFIRYLDSRAREVEAEHHPLLVVDDSRTLAEDFARQLGEAWGVYARPVLLSDLLSRAEQMAEARCVITTFWFTGLAVWARPLQVPVFMMSTRWSPETLEPIAQLSSGAKVLLVFYEEDYIHNGQMFANDLRKALGDSRKTVVSASIRVLEELDPILDSKEFQRVLIGNRIWDHLDERIRQLPHVGRPMVILNKEDLDRLRTRAGVVF